MGVRLTDPIPVPFPRAAPSPGMTIAGRTTTTPPVGHPFACEGDYLPPHAVCGAGHGWLTSNAS